MRWMRGKPEGCERSLFAHVASRGALGARWISYVNSHSETVGYRYWMTRTPACSQQNPTLTAFRLMIIAVGTRNNIILLVAWQIVNWENNLNRLQKIDWLAIKKLLRGNISLLPLTTKRMGWQADRGVMPTCAMKKQNAESNALIYVSRLLLVCYSIILHSIIGGLGRHSMQTVMKHWWRWFEYNLIHSTYCTKRNLYA